MDELIKLLIAALGAAACAAAILTGIAAVAGAGASALAAAGTLALNAAPAALCLGGAAYAASATGYGGLT